VVEIGTRQFKTGEVVAIKVRHGLAPRAVLCGRC
jgi:hypothetical protein